MAESRMQPQRCEWLLFDDRGATWAPRSPKLQGQVSGLRRHDDLSLVRNPGFVAARSFGHNAAIRLHLKLVSDIALAAAFYWLADRNPRRVLIDFAGEGRPAEVCTSAAAAIARLIELTLRHNRRVSVLRKQHPADRPAPACRCGQIGRRRSLRDRRVR